MSTCLECLSRKLMQRVRKLLDLQQAGGPTQVALIQIVLVILKGKGQTMPRLAIEQRRKIFPTFLHLLPNVAVAHLQAFKMVNMDYGMESGRVKFLQLRKQQ